MTCPRGRFGVKTDLSVELIVITKPNLVLLHVRGDFVCHKLAEERINAMARESVRPQTAQRWMNEVAKSRGCMAVPSFHFLFNQKYSSEVVLHRGRMDIQVKINE